MIAVEMSESNMSDVCPIESERFYSMSSGFLKIHFHAQQLGKHSNEPSWVRDILNAKASIDKHEAIASFHQETVQDTLGVPWE